MGRLGAGAPCYVLSPLETLLTVCLFVSRGSMIGELQYHISHLLLYTQVKTAKERIVVFFSFLFAILLCN